jgi:D-amino-acid oxidase
LTEEDRWSLDIGLHNYQPVRDMYRRCLEFMPMLEHAQLDPAEPVRVGLRPVGKGNVCLELEPGTRIVHNYGHGGSGFSFSWGCAHEVTNTVMHALAPERALAA